MLRIALGNASCKDCKDKSEQYILVCENLIFRLENASKLSFLQLSSFSEQTIEHVLLGEKEVSFTTYKEQIDSQNILIVVQGFFHTLKFPNYFSFGGIGRIFVEGIVINSENKVTNAPEQLLWKYK